MKAGWIAEHELADVDRMKTVHVLLRRDGGVNQRFTDVFRQRSLDKDAVEMRGGI